MTTTAKIPADLSAAYDWTNAAGELATLRALDGAALDAYVDESAANAAEHDAHDVTASDLRELAAWLRARAPAWTYDGYWATVLGANRSPADVRREFGLDVSDRRGLDEWLGTAEAEAWSAGGLGGEMPEAWAAHHARALDALCAEVRP